MTEEEENERREAWRRNAVRLILEIGDDFGLHDPVKVETCDLCKGAGGVVFSRPHPKHDRVLFAQRVQCQVCDGTGKVPARLA